MIITKGFIIGLISALIAGLVVTSLVLWDNNANAQTMTQEQIEADQFENIEGTNKYLEQNKK